MWQAFRTMATPRASDILGHVTLVTGPEEFLNQRAVTSAVAAVRASDPESELSETTADQVSMAALGDLAAPSLFSSIRCVVVRNLEDLPDDTYDGLLDYAGTPSEDIGLVLVHSGGPILSVAEVAAAAVSLVGSRRVVRAVPGWRGGVVRGSALAPS